jgi:hypothetical protein
MDAMSTNSQPDPRRLQSLLFARLSIYLLGLTLMIAALAPMVINRLTTGSPPSASVISFSSGILLVGWLFIALGSLLGRQVRWAVWVSFLSAALLAGGGIAMSAASGLRATDVFVIGLSCMVCLACWRVMTTPVSDAPAIEAPQPAPATPAPEAPAATPKVPPVRNSKMFLVRDQ